MRYIASTFSPMMMGENVWAEVVPCGINDIPQGLKSVVSHEITAKILSALLGEEIKFARVNVTLAEGDILFCIIPGFRTTEAREFSQEEVAKAGFRCFQVRVGG